MKQWALRNPVMGHIVLKLVLRLAVALAVMVVLGPVGQHFGVNPNVAAISAVVVGLLVGAKLADRTAKAWGMPPEAELRK